MPASNDDLPDDPSAAIRVDAGIVTRAGATAIDTAHADTAIAGEPAAPVASFTRTMPMPADAVTLAVLAESLRIDTVRRDIGRVVIRKSVRTEERVVDEPRHIERAEVRRVPIGRVVEAPVATRTEGGVTIVPMHEERLVVTRELVLVEELHITMNRSEERAPQTVTLRTEQVDVERFGPEPAGRGVELSLSSSPSPPPSRSAWAPSARKVPPEDRGP